MSLQILPYLHFGGRCEEAIAFYRRAVGAEVVRLMRFKEAPDKSMIQPGAEDKIMHGHIKIGDSQILVSDGRMEEKAAFEGFSLTIHVSDAAAAEKTFAALSEGGKVEMPLGKTFFSPCFGMLEDKFGVGWMVLTQTTNG